MPCSNCKWFVEDDYYDGPRCSNKDFYECIQSDSGYPLTIGNPDRFSCCFYTKRRTSKCPYEHHHEDCDCEGMGGDR